MRMLLPGSAGATPPRRPSLRGRVGCGKTFLVCAHSVNSVYIVIIEHIHYAHYAGHRPARRLERRGLTPVDIIISNSSDKPIYEQIAGQIKGLVLSGELVPGQRLPSIRALASSLRVSAITTKRAYADLEAAGFIETVRGKGSFVTGGNMELVREERLREVETLLDRAVAAGRATGLTDGELREMFDLSLDRDG